MKLIFFLIAIMSLSVNYVNGQKSVDKIQDMVFNNFETGALNAWEPYPYAEDIGFDAMYSTHTTPTYNNSLYALARPVNAHETAELYQGFTKRLNIWITPETHVQAKVYFQSDRSPKTLVISLGTFDGRLYSDTILNPIANSWIGIDIPAKEFQLNAKPLSSGEHVQVITIKATYPMVYDLYTYTILMDNFRINGERQRRFISVNPASTNFNEFGISILNKHFFYGDTMALSVKPEENIPLLQVRGKLVDSKGDVVRNNIIFNNNSGKWTNNSIYHFTTNDTRGQWEIQLNGLTKKGTEVRWSFQFLVPGKPITGYPRLFFSEKELQARLSNEKSPVARNILKNALKDTSFMNVDIDAIKELKDRTSEAFVGGPYEKYTAGFNVSNDWLKPREALENIITNGSFYYAFTGDKAAGEKAKNALLKLCSFSKWNNDWMVKRKFLTYYPVGYLLTSVAYGYDMLHGLLSIEERQLVRNSIMDKGLKPFYEDMVEMNRMPSNMTNHIAVIVSGYCLAATAIYGEDPNNPFLEPYLSGIINKAKTFIDRTYYKDGSYGEPKSGYMYMATREIVKLLASLERNFGIDYSTTTNVEDFYKDPLQASSFSGRMQDFGDGGGADGGKIGLDGIIAEWFVHRTGNPYLYDYLKPNWDKGNGGYFGYLWYRDDIMPISRKALPTSKIFDAQGAIMRSGWEDESTVISTHVGPGSNHNHFDQGSFQIMTNGETLLTDPGVGAGGYYSNPYYRIYNIQAIAHNVMLVDHDPQSQTHADFDNGIMALRSWPRMIHTFVGDIVSEVESDLTSVYKDKLAKYTRTLLYTKSGPLFLFDRVKSNPQGHVFSWLFHVPQNGDHHRSITYNDHQLAVNRPNARLTVNIVSPEIESSKIQDRDRDNESYITLTSKPSLATVNFLSVIVPEAKPVSGEYGPLPKTTRIITPGWIGAKVEYQNMEDFGFFRTNDNATDTINRFNTNARQFTASFDGTGTLVKAYFEGTTFSCRDFFIKSNMPITCAVVIKSSKTNLEVKSSQAIRIAIPLAHRPSVVHLNDSEISTWEYSNGGKILTVPVPKGKNTLFIQD